MACLLLLSLQAGGIQVSQTEIEIRRLSVGPYGMNCYILVCPITRESIIVDPGAEAEKIVRAIEDTKVVGVVVTHRHGDHTGALRQVAEFFEVPVSAHPLDAPSMPVRPDILLDDGGLVQFGQQAAKVIHTPGHTAGSFCLLIGKDLIAGDTLFPGGPGNTQSPEAFEQLIATIQNKIYTLPSDTIIHPGHGEGTTVGNSQKEYAEFAAKPRKPDLCGDVLWASS